MFSTFARAAAAVFATALGTFAGIAPGIAQAQNTPVIGGGSGIVINDMFECTVTTVGHDAAGRLVGLTAGHCGDPGDRVFSDANRGFGQIGKFVHVNKKLDYAVIQFEPGRITPVNRVGNVTISNIGTPPQFPAIVCKEGRTTGNTCGVAWGDVFQTNYETWSQMCVVEGDSGAPVVVGNTLVGMVNAYLALACFGPEVGTDFSAIMDDINHSGAPGAGFRPI